MIGALIPPFFSPKLTNYSSCDEFYLAFKSTLAHRLAIMAPIILQQVERLTYGALSPRLRYYSFTMQKRNLPFHLLERATLYPIVRITAEIGYYLNPTNFYYRCHEGVKTLGSYEKFVLNITGKINQQPKTEPGSQKNELVVHDCKETQTSISTQVEERALV